MAVMTFGTSLQHWLAVALGVPVVVLALVMAWTLALPFALASFGAALTRGSRPVGAWS
jgi:hypothetical protein